MNRKIKVAICDDERAIQDLLYQYLQTYFQRQGILTEIDCYLSADMLADELRKNGTGIDILFLDIQFPNGANGVELGRIIREELHDPFMYLVYISSKTQYAMELFANQPFDFLVKPIAQEHVNHVLDRILENLEADDSCFTYSVRNTWERIRCKDILYLSSEGKRICIHAVSGEFFYVGKLEQAKGQLLEQGFLSIHKSFLVNVRFVRTYAMDHVRLFDGTELPISKANRQDVHRRVMEMMQK